MAIIDLTKPTKASLPHLTQAYQSNFDQVYPWNETGRWIADHVTGAFKYKLSKTDSTKKIDGTAANLSGTDGDVVTKWPAYSYRTIFGPTSPRYEIDTTVPDKYGSNIRPGFKVHPAFRKPDGTVRPFFTLGAFKGFVDANQQLRSVSGMIPTRALTQAAFRDKARQGRTTKHNIEILYQISAVQLMFMVEFQNLNSQVVCGRGKVDYPSTLPSGIFSELETGDTVGLGDRSGYLEVRGETDGKVSMSYRGLEDFYGGIWSFVDGLIITDEGYYHTGDPAKLGNIANYTLSGATPLMGDTADSGKDGYATGMERISTLDFAFLPSAVGGNTSTYYCDHFWTHRRGQTNIALFGGNWYYGSHCGAFCWGWTDVASAANSRIGARLCYLPD